MGMIAIVPLPASPRTERRCRTVRRIGGAARTMGSLIAAVGLLAACAALQPTSPDRPQESAPATTAMSGTAPSPRTAPLAVGEKPEAPAASASSEASEAPVAYPEQGSGTFEVAAGTSAVIGRSGTLLRFQVAVEKDITGLDLVAVAAFVEVTYADPRGWTNGGQWRFQRVGPEQPTNFTVYLVTPATRDALCGQGRDHFTNCREGNRVVLNIARWSTGVPGYGAPLVTYRQYALNHETGHRLGEWHELCPGLGQPAPLMQQQTLGLHGCVANAWPYVTGARYRGAIGAYDDPIPPA
jgi:hypothetical protein